MSSFNTAVWLLFNNQRRFFDTVFSKLNKRGLLYWIGDALFLRLEYWLKFGKALNLNNPKTFNEKLQWLKLYDRKPEYHEMVDKYLVKSYVANKIGSKYVVPTYGVWNDVKDIDWTILPKQFVLKTTNGSGGYDVVVCKDSSRFDKEEAIAKLSTSMKKDSFLYGREWPYKGLSPRIIAEKYLEDKNELYDLKDYKFFCFQGKVLLFKVDFGRFVEHHANYYSREGKLLYFGEALCPPIFDHKEIMPDNIDEMISMAEVLSEGIPFLRVDFYNVQNKIYFGELTFYPASGLGRFIPDEWDAKLGDLIHLDY